MVLVTVFTSAPCHTPPPKVNGNYFLYFFFLLAFFNSCWRSFCSCGINSGEWCSWIVRRAPVSKAFRHNGNKRICLSDFFFPLPVFTVVRKARSRQEHKLFIKSKTENWSLAWISDASECVALAVSEYVKRYTKKERWSDREREREISDTVLMNETLRAER